MAKIGMGIDMSNDGSQANGGVNAVGGPKKRSLLDGLITGLFGAETDDMTPGTAKAVESERAGNRREASGMASAAANNPEAIAKSYMKAPALSGSDATPLSVLGDIVKLFKKPGI